MYIKKPPPIPRGWSEIKKFFFRWNKVRVEYVKKQSPAMWWDSLPAALDLMERKLDKRMRDVEEIGFNLLRINCCSDNKTRQTWQHFLDLNSTLIDRWILKTKYMRKKDRKNLDDFELRVWRKILWVSWTERKTNKFCRKWDQTSR